VDLSSRYMGLRLRNPLVASASPLSHTVDGVRRLADGGVGAVVLHSLFEEELLCEAERQTALAEAANDIFAEALSYFPELPGAEAGPRYYLNLLERSAAAVGVPVIGSVNGATTGGWTGYAAQMEQAGAAAVELNLYGAPRPDVAGRDLEQLHVDIVGLVKSAVSVPVAVKLSPFYSSVGEMAQRFSDAGADALVLFNRFLHSDLDPEALETEPGFGLSRPAEGRLPRTWVALLRPRLRVSLAASTGVETFEDVAKYLLAGADVVMVASALLRHGPGHAQVLLDGLSAWMSRKGFDDLEPVRGLLAAPSGLGQGGNERERYVEALRAANLSASGPW
jgi:dihydroorotate dehydrogenase (fumarate)